MTNGETVREVCAERMESFFVDDDIGGCRMIPAEDVKTRIDHILSAYEREMAAKDAEIERLKKMYDSASEIIENTRLQIAKGIADKDARIKEVLSDYDEAIDKLSQARERIELLERALKPVMEFNLQNTQSDPTSAVREAQRIMKESYNGESHN